MKTLMKKQHEKIPALLCLIQCTNRDEEIRSMYHLRALIKIYAAFKQVFMFIAFIIFWSLSYAVMAGVEPVLSENETLDATQKASYSSLWLKGNSMGDSGDQNSDTYGATTLATHVSMSISGPILRAKIRQTFHNPSQYWSEGVYTFPLPPEASVDQLRMEIGERVIEGQIHEKQAAKQIYQTARDAGKRTSLLNHHRTNVFTTSVANIGPDERIIIEFEYQQVLDFKAQHFELRLPLVNTPKFTPSRITMAPDFVAPINVVRGKHDIPGNPVTIDVELKAGFPIEAVASVSHRLKTKKISDAHYILFVEGNAESSNRDFVLSWNLKPSDKPMVSVLREEVGGESYGLLMVMPPQPEKNEYAAQMTIPRDLVLVLDVSGSMQGQSINQARSSVLKALSKLKPHDRFNIIWFNTRAWKLYSNSQYASAENLNFARQKILSEAADGGTDMRPALRLALRGDTDAEFLRQVVFITDGAVSNEAELFSEIRHHLGQSRLFTVGIGSAPNSYFMQKAARAGRGTFTYVSRPEEVNQKISYLLRQLAAPALTNLRLNLNEDSTVLASQGPLPDLYLGEPMYVSFKANKFPETAVLSATLGGEFSELNVPLQSAVKHAGVAVEWGRRKISAKQDKYEELGKYGVHQMHNDDPLHDSNTLKETKQTLKKDIIKLAINHHQVSKFTSLVAVDLSPVLRDEAGSEARQDRAGGLLKTYRIPANRPQSTPQTIRLAQTATEWKFKFVQGLVLLMSASFLFWVMRVSQRKHICLRT